MEACKVLLSQAQDAEGSYALRLESDPPECWRAQSGFGKQFDPAWALELQSDSLPEIRLIDWELVLVRAVEAYHLSDPVITNFHWPQHELI